MPNAKQEIARIVDANFNRAKEGLRVCEDVCRFVSGEKKLTRDLKNLRHHLTVAVGSLKILKLIEARNIDGDVGRKSNRSELKRASVKDIFYANAQRVKESVRVLEEMAKLVNISTSAHLKKIRYKMYAIEKDFLKRS